MTRFDDWAEFWERNPYPSLGPEAWSPGPHHRQPDPRFVALCEQVGRVGAHVALEVGGTVFGQGDGEHRRLAALMVRHPTLGRACRTVTLGPGETLGHAAARAMESLA